jgi:hypothetical protein
MDYTSHDGAAHRLPRLHKAMRIAAAIMGITPGQALLLIKGLHDDRGTLEVRWVFSPSNHQIHAFGVAWEQCGETARDVRHVADGKPNDLTQDTF